MNRIQEIVASSWETIKGEFDMNTRTWVATVLEGEYDVATLNVVATLIKSAMSLRNAQGQADDYARKAADFEALAETNLGNYRRSREELEEIRAQFTTQNNCILQKCGTTSLRRADREAQTVQEVFDAFVKRAEDTASDLIRVRTEYRDFADRWFRFKGAIAKELGIKGGPEGLDLVAIAARVKGQADAKDSYKRLANARRIRLNEILAALGATEDCHVFQRIEDLTGMVGIATNTLEDIRSVTDCPPDTDLVDWCGQMNDTAIEAVGEMLVLCRAIKAECPDAKGPIEAVQTLALHLKNADKAREYFVEKCLKLQEALEFYANDFNYRQGDFFRVSPVDRDSGSRAQKALGRLQTAGRNQTILMGTPGPDLMHLFEERPREYSPVLLGPWIDSPEHHKFHVPTPEDNPLLQFLGFPVVKSPYLGDDLMFFMTNDFKSIFEGMGLPPKYVMETRYGR